MSGAENLAGIDFQITYTAYRLLDLLNKKVDFDHIRFEGLDEEGQDLEIKFHDNRSEFVQIKKRGEGYSWTTSTIKSIIERFFESFQENRSYVFFSDGPLNRELLAFRAKLQAQDPSSIGDPLLEELRPANASQHDFAEFLRNFHILTRQFVSPNSNDPALTIRAECKALLSKAPFAPLLDVDRAYEKIWELVFEKSRENAVLRADELNEYIENLGIIRSFQGFPLLSADTITRAEENNRISKAIINNDVIYIYGLSGAGKSTLSAQAVMSSCQPDSAMWFSISPSHDASYFRTALVAFLERTGRANSARALRNPQHGDVEAVGHILAAEEITVVFDAIEKASPTLQHFVSQVIRDGQRLPYRAKLIFVGQKLEKWFSEARAYLRKHVVYHLNGFTYSDFLAYLGLDADVSDEFDYRYFFEQTGGLPIATSLLKRALGGPDRVATSGIFKHSAETIHQMLFANLVSTLDDWERDFVEAASVFDGSFTVPEINLLLEKPLSSTSRIAKLVPTGIITQLEGEIQLHDSIRPLAYSYILGETAERFHSKIALYYRDLMETQEHLFELISKWGFHVSKAMHLQSAYMKMISALSREEVFALWGVYYRGFPFAFDERELHEIFKHIDTLLKMEAIIICQNYDASTRTFEIDAPRKVLELNSADEWDTSFLWYRAERDTPAYHMGYMDVEKPNFSWNLQRHTICPWEHRIEFEPLVPFEGDANEILSWFRDAVGMGRMSWRGEAANQNTMQKLEDFLRSEDAVSDRASVDLIVGSCPIFGHCCPGGSDQALICRRADEEATRNEITPAADETTSS
ncbi:dsDNA nuclease domain-containing protein [Rhizobium laguerreae]|uniref:dsDNA nuclease domain-containing protein n=1 Tax=Rhizobium laguerreae TaxID=1076926 RepID=UPI001442195F|nr:dsDNA nuclease domain-containing protein [Rhizobium laguerreae]